MMERFIDYLVYAQDQLDYSKTINDCWEDILKTWEDDQSNYKTTKKL